MVRTALGFSLSLIVSLLHCNAQGINLLDSIRSSSVKRVYELRAELPLGQTFIHSSRSRGFTNVRATIPDKQMLPTILTDSSSDKVFTRIAMGSTYSSVEQKTVNGTSQASYSCQISSVNTISEPKEFIWEIQPDPEKSTGMDLHFGFGASRLDLSGLKIHRLNIDAGASDLYISYEKANTTTMNSMVIRGGMSKIVIRNAELARAKKVHIENGMGATKIMIGDQLHPKNRIFCLCRCR